jgi:hypothetical protein
MDDWGRVRDLGIPRALNLEGDHFDPVTAVVGFNDHQTLHSHPSDGVDGKDRTKRWSAAELKGMTSVLLGLGCARTTITRTVWHALASS